MIYLQRLVHITPKTHLVVIFTVKGLMKEQHGSHFTMHYKPRGCSYKMRVVCMCARARAQGEFVVDDNVDQWFPAWQPGLVLTEVSLSSLLKFNSASFACPDSTVRLNCCFFVGMNRCKNSTFGADKLFRCWLLSNHCINRSKRQLLRCMVLVHLAFYIYIHTR